RARTAVPRPNPVVVVPRPAARPGRPAARKPRTAAARWPRGQGALAAPQAASAAAISCEVYTLSGRSVSLGRPDGLIHPLSHSLLGTALHSLGSGTFETLLPC